jgi:uncharacterized protein with ATP-grasp and redox domains
VRTYFECIPCFVHQALRAVRYVTDDEAIQEQVLRETLRAAAEMDLRRSPPAMAQQIHRIIRRLTGAPDPYRAAKEHFNQVALAMYPKLAAEVDASDRPLETAVRFAIAGNVIDLGTQMGLDEAAVHEAVAHARHAPLRADLTELASRAVVAEQILYLADNAGELVFDRLLIEQLGREKITVAVKGSPILNDATREDAEAAGLMGFVAVIDNGSDAPGTLLGDCSNAFRARFAEADLVVAKGQGNYETLSRAPRDVFFILKAKCPVIAEDLGCEVGSLVLRQSAPAPVATGR